MSETNFKSLQRWHENLLLKESNVSDNNKQDFVNEVKEYIYQTKKAGSFISSNQERNQLRANLNYWANYVYTVERTFPNTDLAPSAVESRPLSASFAVTLIIFVLIILVGARLLFRGGSAATPTKTPPSIPTAATIGETPTAEPIQVTASPTSVFVGSDVALTSPENGENVLPRVVFRGAYTNLKTGSTIHVFLIKSDRLYPIKNFFTISSETRTGEWELPAELYLKPEELDKAETLVVVPATCYDDSCRETLASAVKTGISIESLPSPFSFTLYRDSSRVVYRNAFRAVQEKRLLYSLHNGDSYDIYASKPDGSDPININEITADIDERDPQFSPDGRQIVYVKYFKTTNMFAIYIMNSNGQNDHEALNLGNNWVENPQWSPDSSYISYAVGEQRGSSNNRFWSIHVYQLSSKTDTNVSGEPHPLINRYSTWIPNTNILIFDEGIGELSRFLQQPMNSENHTVYFDPKQYVAQPSISSLSDGYLLTYIAIGTASPYYHDVYAAIDLDGKSPFDGIPTKLIDSFGGIVNFPQVDPDSNYLYYTRDGAILRVEYQVDANKIKLVLKANTSASGERIIKPGPRRDDIFFDVNFMEAFFPKE